MHKPTPADYLRTVRKQKKSHRVKIWCGYMITVLRYMYISANFLAKGKKCANNDNVVDNNRQWANFDQKSSQFSDQVS